MQKHVTKRRLLKLAAFLDTLPPEKWDFLHIITRKNPSRTCGTVCCAIGWTPVVFPRLIKWKDLFVRSKRAYEIVKEQSQRLFGLSTEQINLLFIPRVSWNSESNQLPISATSTDVANHIRKFCKNL